MLEYLRKILRAKSRIAMRPLQSRMAMRPLQSRIAMRPLLLALMLSAGIAAQSFAVTATVDVTIGVRPGHKVAPERVTDMTAATGSQQGQLDLS